MIRRILLLFVVIGSMFAGAAEAQVVRGTVVDGSNGAAVPLAGVFLLDRDRSVVVQTMSDSLGRYVLEAPAPGDYVLAGQRLGYVQMASALLALGEDTYELDLELQPDPFQFDPLEVTVRNEVLVDWFRFEAGVNPNTVFGYRAIQGADLMAARQKARDNTDMLRWLYIPVSHGMEPCVGWRMPDLPRPGEEVTGPPCGRLWLDGRPVLVEHIETLDRWQVAVVVVLPPDVYLFTREFDGSQPLVRWAPIR
jgi:hypothetical protein